MVLKIFVMLFIISCMIIIKEIYKFTISLIKVERYTISNKEMIIFMIAFSYFLTMLITGFSL